jgi:hypothetical protein
MQIGARLPITGVMTPTLPPALADAPPSGRLRIADPCTVGVPPSTGDEHRLHDCMTGDAKAP